MSFDSNEDWSAKQAYQEALASPYVKALERVAKASKAWVARCDAVARDPMQAWAQSPIEEFFAAVQALEQGFPGKP